MKQAIVVRYKGATQTRGSRWVATGGGARITVPFDYEASHSGIRTAVDALMRKLGWTEAYVIGALPNGDYVAVRKE